MKRRVLAQFVSGHMHIEMVEVTADVHQYAVDKIEADVAEIEREARVLLRQNCPAGPWSDPESSFQLMCVLCGTDNPLARGRIVVVDQVAYDEVKRWRRRGEAQ